MRPRPEDARGVDVAVLHHAMPPHAVSFTQREEFGLIAVKTVVRRGGGLESQPELFEPRDALGELIRSLLESREVDRVCHTKGTETENAQNTRPQYRASRITQWVYCMHEAPVM